MRALFFGDSFVNGTHDPLYRGWVSRLCAESSRIRPYITCYNLGVRRDTSADILRRWENEFSARKVQDETMAAVFSYGVNDTMLEQGAPRIDPAMSMDNTRRMMEGAVQVARVLFISPTPLKDPDHNDRLREMNTRLKPLLAEYSVPFLDLFPGLLASPEWMNDMEKNDGIHPLDSGYAALSEIVFRWPAWQDLLKTAG